MEEIFLTIPGKPISKQTHRNAYKVDWKNKEVKSWNWFPQRAEANDVSNIMRSQYNGPLIDEGVFIIFEFYMPIPTRWSKDLKEKARNGILHHMVKPDSSNLVKFYEDCMNGVIIFDDSRVIWGPPIKLYADIPRTEILIKPFKYEDYIRFKQALGRRIERDSEKAA